MPVLCLCERISVIGMETGTQWYQKFSFSDSVGGGLENYCIAEAARIVLHFFHI